MEKLLAALRGGITKVLIPAENEKDLAEIPANIREGLEIVTVAHVDEVLAQALATPVVPIEWSDADDLAALPPTELAGGSEEGAGLSVRH
jgi:ATP-dependent Lon protease